MKDCVMEIFCNAVTWTEIENVTLEKSLCLKKNLKEKYVYYQWQFAVIISKQYIVKIPYNMALNYSYNDIKYDWDCDGMLGQFAVPAEIIKYDWCRIHSQTNKSLEEMCWRQEMMSGAREKRYLT